MQDQPTEEARRINQAVGLVLRHNRQLVGLTRKQLLDRLPYKLGPHTLLSYESGARQMSVARFVELCAAMQVPAPALLHSALQRADSDWGERVLRVDLHAVLSDRRPERASLRHWARNRIDHTAEAPQVIEIKFMSVREMAAFAEVDTNAMIQMLAEFAPLADRPTA